MKSSLTRQQQKNCGEHFICLTNVTLIARVQQPATEETDLKFKTTGTRPELLPADIQQMDYSGEEIRKTNILFNNSEKGSHFNFSIIME